MRQSDIIISAETAVKDAKKNKKNFYDHFTHLIVHSLLHINGYKHNEVKFTGTVNAIKYFV